MGPGRRKAEIRHARPVIFRIMQIHRLLEGGACPGVPELAGQLEVSTRTVERDLELLRDQFRAPLAYDRLRRGYYYEKKYSLPTMKLTTGELMVLLIGQRILADMAGTPFARSARHIVAKLPLLLGDEISVDLNFLGNEISFGLPPVRGDEDKLDDHFHKLSTAVEKRQTVQVRYYAATRDEMSERQVDPYHLRLEAGAWYVIGYCHLRGELRTLAVDRIQHLALTGATFTRPKDFSIEKYLGNSWGIEHGKEHTVRVEFDPQQARWIRERIWLPDQELTELPGGGVILTVRVSGLETIKRWILGFGSHATVLEPLELAAAIRAEAEGILRNGAKMEESKIG